MKKVKVRPPETREEFIEEAEKSFQTFKGESEIPLPTYNFQVGQAIRYGNRPDCLIESLSEEGRKILLSYADRGEKSWPPL